MHLWAMNCPVHPTHEHRAKETFQSKNEKAREKSGECECLALPSIGRAKLMNVRCVTNMVGENRFGKFMFAQCVSRC